MGSDAAVRIVSPAPREQWRRIFAADPSALVTQSPEWTDVMVELGGRVDASIAMELPGGRELVLPLVRRSIGGTSSFHASFGEGWGMGGVLAPDGPSAADVATVVAALGTMKAVQTSIRPNPLLGGVWRDGVAGRDLVSIPKTAHVLDLGNGDQDIFATKLTKNGRRDVRRAERLGVQVVAGSGSESVPLFYDMMKKSIERWAARSREPVRLAQLRFRRRDPLRKFEIMADRLGDAMRIYVARVGGTPAACTVVLIGANAHYTRGAMDVDVAGPINASDIAQWTAIRDAAAAGCKSYHMGESGNSASLARFKEKFGARPVPYAQYRFERLPVTAADTALRRAVKKAIGFRDG